MKANPIKNKKGVLGGLGLALGLIFSVTNAHAAGTVAGTPVNNQATLNFAVSGISQPSVNSNIATFVVDNRINMTIVGDNGGVPTNVTPGGTGSVYKFLLTNTGNSPQDYLLTSNSTGFNGQTLLTKVDNFDVTGCVVRVDGNANGTYEAANDTASYVDELAPDASRGVFLLCNTPSTRANADFSIASVTAQVANGGTSSTQGTALTENTGVDNVASVDIVFGDSIGTDDIVRDGKISARGGYLVVSATVAITKSSLTVCDPVNFNSNPKAIPGAFVRYTINIANAAGAGASANLGALGDAIDVTNLNFDSNLVAGTASACSAPESAAGRGFKISCTGGTRACVATPAYKTTAADADGVSFGSGSVTADFNTLLGVESGYATGELKPGESVNLIFNVQVK